VVSAISAQVKKFVGGTVKTLGDLYSSVTAHKVPTTRAIEYAAVAALVLAIGATAMVRVRRHRKLPRDSATFNGA
jgi:hypothetical protein